MTPADAVDALEAAHERALAALRRAVQRFANGAEPKNAIAAGKDRADRIFRASYQPHPPSAA